MELNLGREVESNIVGGRQFTTTENSSKLFAMLSNMLYKDKERSTLTEISSNAIDAHKLVGKEDHPIHVTMPTTLAPEIRVRDFGPGLSEDNVYRFLTTYGESSKQTSNDFIGGFGIGSKSPASVSDSWTIHSYHEGVHKQYLIHVSATGIPSLTKIVEKPTTESGLEVVIPVRPQSFYTWQEAAKKAYMAYPVRPVFHNANFTLPELKWHLDMPSMCFGNVEQRSYASALINHRLYPLDPSKIETKNNLVVKLLQRGGVVFKFSIGELNLNLSREDLQYDHHSILNIEKRVLSALDEMQTLWNTEIVAKYTEQMEYYVESVKLLNKWFPDSPRSWLNEIYMWLSEGVAAYNSQFDFTSQRLKLAFGKTDLNMKFYSENAGRFSTRSNFTFGWVDRQYDYQAKEYDHSLILSLQDIEKMVFVVNDVNMAGARAKLAYADNNFIMGDNFNMLPDFLKGQVVLASTLPKPTINRTRAAREKVDSEYFRIVGGHFERVELNSFSANSPLVYVKFTKATSTSTIVEEFQKNLDLCLEYGAQVVAIKEGTPVPSIAVHPNVFVENKFNELYKFADLNAKANLLEVWQGRFESRHVELEYVKRTAHPSEWNNLVNMLTDIKAELKGYNLAILQRERSKLERLANRLGKTVTATSYDAATKNFRAAYPMVTLMIDNSYVDLTDSPVYGTLFEYVESIGK